MNQKETLMQILDDLQSENEALVSKSASLNTYIDQIAE